jgi:hypothetical protein
MVSRNTKVVGITSLIFTTHTVIFCLLLTIMAIGAIIVTGGTVMIVYAIPIAPSAEALEYLKGDNIVKVSYESNWYIFSRRNNPRNGGLIFYPGKHSTF